MSEKKPRSKTPILELPTVENETRLKLKLGTATNPVDFSYSAPTPMFDTELTKLMLMLPALLERLQPTTPVTGALAGNVTLQTGAYQMTDTDFIVLANASAGPVVVTLPPISAPSQIVLVCKVDSSANTVEVLPYGAGTIEGAASVNLTSQYQKLMLANDMNQTWLKIAEENA